MSGTSLDGIDAVLIESGAAAHHLRASLYQPYGDELRRRLLALHTPSSNELQNAAIMGNELARCYATAVIELLRQSGAAAKKIAAIGCHGQTVRHRPELGFTLQLGNSALLAELTNITVVSDFRSRDIAAGGQGAPLVPAFHQALFMHRERHRAIVNIGGIANITDLPPNGRVTGFDCGPGNLLMDSWAQRHLGKPYDAEGRWAASGQPISRLLQSWLHHPFFQQAPPKSTGRDTFNMAWLEQCLQPGDTPADVQATLLELTARSIAAAIRQYCGAVREIFLCGGGARNKALLHRLQDLLDDCKVDLTDSLGIGTDWVEAAAFAWLAKQTMDRRPGNLPAATGAAGPRILGAIHPA